MTLSLQLGVLKINPLNLSSCITTLPLEDYV